MFKNFNFNLFGDKWKVKFMDAVEQPAPLTADGSWVDGMCYGEKGEIHVAIKDKEGTPKPPEKVQQILMHEVVHAIFTSGQYLSCTNDEPLVEWMAKAIISLSKQNVI